MSESKAAHVLVERAGARVGVNQRLLESKAAQVSINYTDHTTRLLWVGVTKPAAAQVVVVVLIALQRAVVHWQASACILDHQ